MHKASQVKSSQDKTRLRQAPTPPPWHNQQVDNEQGKRRAIRDQANT